MAFIQRSSAGVLLAVLLLGVSPARAQEPETAAASPASAASSSADLPMPSFASLFTDLLGDTRHLATPANALWLGAFGGAALAVHTEDSTLTRQAVGSLGLEEALDGGASLGGGWVQGGVALGTYFVGRFSGRPDVAVLGSDLWRAQVFSTLITETVKVAVDRERPDGTSYSFPSGHSASTFATATVLARHFGWKVGIPAYGMATYVAASRLTENRHYLSDVIFGAGIGIVSGRAVTVGSGNHKFALGPTVVPGGVGVSFTRIGGQ